MARSYRTVIATKVSVILLSNNLYVLFQEQKFMHWIYKNIYYVIGKTLY